MSDDVLERWRKAEHAWDYAPPDEDNLPNVSATTFELWEAGKALAAELEKCRERLRRVELFCDELERETFSRTLEGQAIESTQLRCAGKLREALGLDP